MLGIIVTTHGGFAEGLVNAAEMIAGEQAALKYISLEAGEDVKNYQIKLMEAVKDLSVDVDEVIFCVDMLGATPFNTCVGNRQQILENLQSFALVSGINLPILLEFITRRQDESLKDLVNDVLSIADTTINSMFFETE